MNDEDKIIEVVTKFTQKVTLDQAEVELLIRLVAKQLSPNHQEALASRVIKGLERTTVN